MAFPSEPQAVPIASASGDHPNDSSPDMRHPQVHAVLRRTRELYAQTFRLQHHILQFFTSFLVVFKRFMLFVWDLSLRPQAPTADRLPDAPGPHAQPSPQHKDAGDVSITSQPQDCTEVDEGTVNPAPSPVQAESKTKEVIEIIDSEDEDEEKKEIIEIDDSDDESVETSLSEQASEELDNQESEEEGRDEPVQEDEDVQEQQSSPPANNASIDEEQDAESPGSMTANLSGDTLVEPKSSIDIPRPKFSDECPRLKRKSDSPPPQPQPERPDDQRYIDCGYTFVDDFGWVKETPKKRRGDALGLKMVKSLSDTDNASGVVYILRHKHYENLYKVGSTKLSIKARVAKSGPCVKGMTEEAGKIGKVWGFRRVEALAHRDMASRNVNMGLCTPCLNKAPAGEGDGKNRKRKGKKNGDEDEQKETSHTEWFKGDLEDITRCVEYWAEVVKASYDYKGKFVGDFSGILDRGLSSQRRKLETEEDSAELRDGLNMSPSRCSQSPDPAGSPGTDTHAAREEGDEDEEGAEVGGGCGEGEGESEESEGTGEVRSRHGGVIWKRADSSSDRPFRALEDGAVRRGSRTRRSTSAAEDSHLADGLRPGTETKPRRSRKRKSTGAEEAQPADGLRLGTEAKRRSPRLRKSAGAEIAHPAGELRPAAGIEHAVSCQA